MTNKVLGLLLMFVLVIASCVTDPVDITDDCEVNDIGDLTIVNETSGTDAVPMDIYINSTFTGTTLSPGAEFYAGALAPGAYEIEGRSTTVSFVKNVTLIQCDDLFVLLGN